jgi:hypothetical protein
MGIGVPIAAQMTVMLPPSSTMFIGWIVGTSTTASYAGSVQAIKVSDGRLSPFSFEAVT